MPATIPILTSGKQKLTILGGVKKNGFVNQRVIYPFLKSFDLEKEFIPSKVDTVSPIMSYNDNVTFPWIEDFEDPGVKFNKLSYSDTNVFITNMSSEVFEGNGSGVIRFDDSHLFFEAKTNETTFNSFPKAGRPVYIEIDYNSNEVITLGFYHNNTSSIPVKYEFINLNPTNGVWKKAYINLADGVSRQISASIFDIYIEVEKNKSVKPEVFIDNIKVIY